MAKKSNSRRQDSKKFNVLVFILLISLVLGAGIGYFIGFTLIKNDKFIINGESTIEIYIGQTYEDEGATAISFGKDVSNKIKTENNINTAEEGQYYIKYTVDNIRYKGVERYRVIIVKPLQEEVQQWVKVK